MHQSYNASLYNAQQTIHALAVAQASHNPVAEQLEMTRQENR